MAGLRVLILYASLVEPASLSLSMYPYSEYVQELQAKHTGSYCCERVQWSVNAMSLQQHKQEGTMRNGKAMGMPSLLTHGERSLAS